ncbi:Metallo-dependent phosphatase-like protein [Halteromyces radiatus]|uniref:Metallo-dependent phosphatase-like protein n=1 Tax=Halteromyces radiatus TaxID=101107 RepID=UPI0022209948|nr:Metallo-dependent phosphatase-like protein [Halteromyces radiatus]KAI8082958.1 Metallo-dependent phosphatase-like protein [Halteromyces radiatus]
MNQMVLLIIGLFLFCFIQTSLAIESTLDSPRRIVAMGDLHGDLANTKKILALAGLIDEKGHWSGQDAIYVQTGDVLDRGTDTIALYELIQQLREEAPEQGGLVIPLLGNHEIMNLVGDWRYVTQKEMATFGGQQQRIQAFQPDGFLGSYLTQLNLTTKVGGNVFCHGGIHPDFAKWGPDLINDYTHQDILDYMHSHHDPHHLFGANGPTWYRGYALEDEPEICTLLDQALDHMEADRMIMGHTVQQDGEIKTRCNGRIVLVDIGISWVYGRHVGALEILGDQLTAIYEHGRVSLTPPFQPIRIVHQEL